MDRRPGTPVHDDLVQREFKATKANERWTTDIIGHHTLEGTLSSYPIQDVFSERIVGYSIGPRTPAALVDEGEVSPRCRPPDRRDLQPSAPAAGDWEAHANRT